MKLIGRLEVILERVKDFPFLLTTFIIFFLLRFPSLFEPYWYGDEGIYQTIGKALRSGRLLYKDIWDNKPPFLYLLYSLFDSDQFTIRLVSLLAGILTVFVFYKLAQKLFANTKAVQWSTMLFAILFGLPLLEGNIANSENFMLLPVLWASLLAVTYQNDQKKGRLIAAGLLLSVAFLFKVVAIFDFTAIAAFLFIHLYGQRHISKQHIGDLVLFVVSFIVPFLLVSLYFLANGAFSDFLSASFVQNVTYVGYGNKFIIPQGLLLLKLVLLALIVITLFRKRRVFSRSLLFIILSFSFAAFNAFFSQRPYTHYLLVLLPSLLLLFGLICFDKIEGKQKRFAVAIFSLVSFFVLISFRFYIKTPLYYYNFISFITMQKSVADYRGFFDGATPRDYELTDYINLYNKKQFLFIWGNNAQLYKLTDTLPPGRYTVAYHITATQKSIDETKNALEEKKPHFIITMSNDVPFSLAMYRQKIIISGVSIYERAF